MKQIILDKTKLKNGVYFLSGIDNSFESIYISVRQHEKRVYSDDEVKHLPDTESNNTHKDEWSIRKKSLARFYSYIQKYNNTNLLDIGCGNGWFSANVAGYSSINIYALDVNKLELEQAARVFKLDNLHFIYGNIFEEIFENNSFDIITLNSSIQYFVNLKLLFNRLIHLLTDNGEIHVIDSPIYNQDELIGARERTARYYISNGFPEMAKHYHHHSFDELNFFKYKIQYDPKSLQKSLNKILGIKDSPFPWIIIRK